MIQIQTSDDNLCPFFPQIKTSSTTDYKNTMLVNTQINRQLLTENSVFIWRFSETSMFGFKQYVFSKSSSWNILKINSQSLGLGKSPPGTLRNNTVQNNIVWKDMVWKNTVKTSQELRMLSSRVYQSFFFKKKIRTHQASAWGLVWRDPRGFLILTKFRGSSGHLKFG